MILTISCAKDYNALFNERVAELNKEGKYILNQYNDSVGKEHYIVYIDADKIVVDTLGDSLQVYSLGKVETYQYFPNVDFNDGKFSMERYNSTDFTLKADTAKKQIMVSDDTFYPKGKIVKFSELTKTLPQDQPVFVGESKVYNSTVNDVLTRHCRRCGISEISIHGLRHTHASLLLFAGVSIASVARRLGHASMTTTQKTYLHIIQELENKDVDLVMRTLSGL